MTALGAEAAVKIKAQKRNTGLEVITKHTICSITHKEVLYMAYEVDFLAVGDKGQSGDAISFWYGDLGGDRDGQTVVVIDAGFTDTGKELADHIEKYYGTKIVDLVISTHPDQDHINGLTYILENMEVKELWIHQPWEHNELLKDEFSDGRITNDSMEQRLKDNLQKSYDLVKLAKSKGIIVNEPYTGLQFGENLRILGPTKDYYISLVPDFDGMPKRKQTADASTFRNFLETAVAFVKRKAAGWGKDELDNEDTTSAKNNSSAITQLDIDGRRLLFTGDAGVTALSNAADEIETLAVSDLKFFQVPHHGSKRNLGPEVLNRLIGKPLGEGEKKGVSAFVSCAIDGKPKHPSAKILNSLTHRGVNVVTTKGTGKYSRHETDMRVGWSEATIEDYKWEYEETE